MYCRYCDKIERYVNDIINLKKLKENVQLCSSGMNSFLNNVDRQQEAFNKITKPSNRQKICAEIRKGKDIKRKIDRLIDMCDSRIAVCQSDLNYARQQDYEYHLAEENNRKKGNYGSC